MGIFRMIIAQAAIISKAHLNRPAIILPHVLILTTMTVMTTTPVKTGFWRQPVMGGAPDGFLMVIMSAILDIIVTTPVMRIALHVRHHAMVSAHPRIAMVTILTARVQAER